mmetsp:Transcript_13740/g.31829  ORF Transcript_13740/g.31829 Transcript_13740/m.31829 type:complete len:239 (-) Transcript_13740:1248-1964(-)
MRSAVSPQRTASSPKALVSTPARASLFSQSSACSRSPCCSSCAALSCAWSSATLASTSASWACFTPRVACASCSVLFASARRAFLGSTSLATRAYTSMAIVHMHMPLAALDTLPTCSALYSGSERYFCSVLSDLAVILSLSKVISRLRKPPSPSCFLAVSQSLFSPRSAITASIVVCTSGGGLENDLISVISPLVSWLRAARAESSAGSASSRSRCASSCTSRTSSACCPTSAVSPAT